MKTLHFNWTEHKLIAAWLTMNLCIGIMIVHDFGISFDEAAHYSYADQSLQAYRLFLKRGVLPEFGISNLQYYGPSFTTGIALIIHILRKLGLSFFEIDVWHFAYFFAFQLCGLGVFALARRWFSAWTSWVILVLFTSQPLLWGHAFINPKDIPFMTFFILSISTGFSMTDFWQNGQRVSNELTLRIILAGILLGLVTSMRVLGPWAGVLVCIYLSLKAGGKSLPIIFLYLSLAAVTAYITWPFLWGDPIENYFESIKIMYNFSWSGEVLFNGYTYTADSLPRIYLPLLLNIQLTEPVLALFYLGFGFFLFHASQDKIRIDAVLLIVMGFILPLAALIIVNPPLYDNFRQILFILPVMFLVSGFALDEIKRKINQSYILAIILVALAFPGIHSSLQLHPYEYVYYNSIVGGTSGAYQRFEMDYWLTAYRELALELNEFANEGSTILTISKPITLTPYLRPDMLVEDIRHATHDPKGGYDYAVLTTRNNTNLQYPKAPVILAVKRDNAIFAILKQVKGQSINGVP